MLQFSPARIALILVAVFASLFFALPNTLPSSVWEKGPSWWRPMHLGLDLKGGSYLLLQVDTGAVIKEQVANLQDTVRGALLDANLKYRNLHTADNAVLVSVDPDEVDAARSAIAKSVSGMTIETQGPELIRVSIPDKVQHDKELAALSQSLEIVRRRIDAFGTTEPTIEQQGSDRIIVELPGVKDPDRIKALIGQTAKLTFHLLEPGAENADPTNLPPGTELLHGEKDDPRTYVVRRHVEVGGERLLDSQPTFQDGRPVVSFRFDTAGARLFGQVTSDNVGQRLAIVLDQAVISAPTIESPIYGNGIITGNFTAQSANDLAVLLRAGALPAPLNVIQENTVGPGLGADSIRDGATAFIVGAGLVVVFMILAYHTFGIFAVFGQVFHMITLFAVLSLMGGTLSLPGIAGVVLSLGMAVDANVLIYERMREESQTGRTMLSAITAGFSHAYATIVDSNLTNFIAALLLFLLGAGPVRGFAATLSIGIVTSIFSAVMITRLQVWMWYRSGKRKALPI